MSTKTLAQELGLLRQRSQGSSGSEKHFVSNQIFSYIIVIDFESTCWKEKNNYGQEIIEFPAVLLNTSTGEVESEFHTYTQPQEHPVLSEFCTELTGITQMQVEAGVPLLICLSRFSRWLQNLQGQKGLVFQNRQQEPVQPSASQKLCTFLTWSDWDLGVCLQYECKRKQINKPPVLNSWIDLRSTYRLFYNRKPKGLNGALQDLGIQFEGREHSGLDDARNTAQLAARMMRDGCVMRITSSLHRTPLTSTTAPAKINKNKPIVHNEQKENSGKAATARSFTKSAQTLNTTESLVQSLVSPKTLLNGTVIIRGACKTNSSVRANMSSLCSTSVDCFPLVPQSQLNVKEALCEEILVETNDRCGSYDDMVLDDVPEYSLHTATTTDTGAKIMTTSKTMSYRINKSDQSNTMKPNSTKSEAKTCFAVPKPVTKAVRSNHFTKMELQTFSSLLNKSEINCRVSLKQQVLVPNTPNASFLAPFTKSRPSKAAFSIYSHPSNPCSSTPLSSRYVSRTVLATLSSNTSLAGTVVGPVKGPPRITSPLCSCGRRAKRQLVSNGGPNHGRVFFCCSVRRSGTKGRVQKGCEFFIWESAMLRGSSMVSAAAGSSVSLCQG